MQPSYLYSMLLDNFPFFGELSLSFDALFGSAILIDREQFAMKMHSVRILSLPILLDFGHAYPD